MLKYWQMFRWNKRNMNLVSGEQLQGSYRKFLTVTGEQFNRIKRRKGYYW